MQSKGCGLIMVEMSSEDKELMEENTEVAVEPLAPCDPLNQNKPAPFEFITENVYITMRATSREGKRAKRMMCDCQFDPENDDPSDACGENCLNRLLMIECGNRCPCGEYCNNKKFSRRQYAPVEVFKTEMKGWGLRATDDIPSFSFVMEYCGEVCTPEEFELRRREYEQSKRRHYYFMSLKTDEILDATRKGNLSRFINHSCDPNCETQKWTVNGKLRVGFFALRSISNGDELTFDYQFQRFGKTAQKCYCSSVNCRGYLGAPKQSDSTSSGRSDTLLPINGRDKRGRPRGNDADAVFEREIYDIVGGSWRLKNIDQVLSFSRLMLRAESLHQRGMLLKVLQATQDLGCLKRFLSLQGLRLLWSWMVELTDLSTVEALDTKLEILQSLKNLPISNKNLLTDNKVLQVVQKWAETKVAPPIIQTVNTNTEESATVVISEADCSISPQDDDIKALSSDIKETIDEQNKEPDNEMEMEIMQERDMEKEREEEREEPVVPEGDAKPSKEEVSSEIIPDKEPNGNDVIEEMSSEAEARETTSDGQDEEIKPVDEEVIAMATDLLEKWSSLKEVFRIPKKIVPKLKVSSPVDDDESSRSKQEKKEDDPIEIKKKRKRESRWEDEPALSKGRKRASPSLGVSPTASPKPVFRPGLLGATPSTIPPLQNTVIVQPQPGHGVFVQQHIFPTAINPTPSGLVSTHYVPQTTGLSTNPAHSLFVPPSTLPSLLPLPVSSSTTQVRHISSQPYLAQSVGVAELQLAPLPPPPPLEGLPSNWREAKDSSGKVYYYHVITRKTQWDRPSEDDKDGDILMDLGTPEDNESLMSSPEGQPHTPEESPPSSPSSEVNEKQVTKATNKHRKRSRPKDIFRHSLSKLIVRCLDHHRKPDCKYGRITCSEDFKHLARKLTFGITEKEISRKSGNTDLLDFSDQVKSRVKDYIRNYMKKFGPIYKRS